MVLLSSGDVVKPVIKDCQHQKDNQVLKEGSFENENYEHDYGKLKQKVCSNSNSISKKRKNRKQSVLEGLREDFREYHKEKIKFEKQKLEQTIRKNNAIEERNKLIQRFLDAHGSVPSIL